jgi:hypothetical protein
MDLLTLHFIPVMQAYSVSGPQDVADCPESVTCSWLTLFPVVSSDLPFRYPLQYN